MIEWLRTEKQTNEISIWKHACSCGQQIQASPGNDWKLRRTFRHFHNCPIKRVIFRNAWKFEAFLEMTCFPKINDCNISRFRQVQEMTENWEVLLGISRTARSKESFPKMAENWRHFRKWLVFLKLMTVTYTHTARINHSNQFIPLCNDSFLLLLPI